VQPPEALIELPFSFFKFFVLILFDGTKKRTGAACHCIRFATGAF
jgi:hypothetical protein